MGPYQTNGPLLDTQVFSGSVKRGSDRWRFLGIHLNIYLNIPVPWIRDGILPYPHAKKCFLQFWWEFADSIYASFVDKCTTYIPAGILPCVKAICYWSTPFLNEHIAQSIPATSCNWIFSIEKKQPNKKQVDKKHKNRNPLKSKYGLFTTTNAWCLLVNVAISKYT